MDASGDVAATAKCCSNSQMLQQQPNVAATANQQLQLQAFEATPVGSRGVKAQANITKDSGSGRSICLPLQSKQYA
jgi:hypothetical protein